MGCCFGSNELDFEKDSEKVSVPHVRNVDGRAPNPAGCIGRADGAFGCVRLSVVPRRAAALAIAHVTNDRVHQTHRERRIC